jgi:hypothetical protein
MKVNILMKHFNDLIHKALETKFIADYTRLSEGRQLFIFEKTCEILNEDGADIRARRAEESRLRQAGVLKPNEQLPSVSKQAGEEYQKNLSSFRQWGLGKLMDISDVSGWTDVSQNVLSPAASQYFDAGVEELGRAESEMKDKFPGKYKELRDVLVQDLVRERKSAFDEGDTNISEKDLLTRVLSKNKNLADVLTRDEYETVAGGITNPLRIETEDGEGNKKVEIDLPRWTGINQSAANVYDIGAGAADVLTDPVQLGTAVASGGAFNLATRGVGTLGGKVAAGLASRAPASVKTAAEASKRFLPPILGRARSAEELGKAAGRASVAVGGAAMIAPSAVQAASQDKLARWSGELFGSAAPFVLGSKLTDKAIAAYNKSKIEPKVSPKPETAPEAAKDVKVSDEIKFEIPPSGSYPAKDIPIGDFGAPAKSPLEISKRPDYANPGEMLRAFGYLPNIYKATKGRQGGAFTAKMPEPAKTEVSKPLAPVEISRETINNPFYQPPAVGSQRVDSGVKPSVPIIFWTPPEQFGGGDVKIKRRRRTEPEISLKPEEPKVSGTETIKKSDTQVDWNAPAIPPFPEYSPRPQWANTGEMLKAFGLSPEIFKATKGRRGGAFTAQIPEPAPIPEPKTTLSSTDIKTIEGIKKPQESILTRAAKAAETETAKPEISPKPPEELTPDQIQDLLQKLSPVSFQFPKQGSKPSLPRVAASVAAIPGAGSNILSPQTSMADLFKTPQAAEVRPAIEISVPKWASETKPVEIINGEQIAKAVADMMPKMKAPTTKPRIADETLPPSTKPEKIVTKSVETQTLQEPSSISGAKRPTALSQPKVPETPTNIGGLNTPVSLPEYEPSEGGMNTPVSLPEYEPPKKQPVVISPPAPPKSSKTLATGGKEVSFGGPEEKRPEIPTQVPSWAAPEYDIQLPKVERTSGSGAPPETLPEPSQRIPFTPTTTNGVKIKAPEALSTSRVMMPSSQPVSPESPKQIAVAPGSISPPEILPEPKGPEKIEPKTFTKLTAELPSDIGKSRGMTPSSQPVSPESPKQVAVAPGSIPPPEILPEPKGPEKIEPKTFTKLTAELPSDIGKSRGISTAEQPSVSTQQIAQAEREKVPAEVKAPAEVKVPFNNKVPHGDLKPSAAATAAATTAAVISTILNTSTNTATGGGTIKNTSGPVNPLPKPKKGGGAGAGGPGIEVPEEETQTERTGVGTEDWNLILKDIYGKYAATLSK